MLGNGVIGQIPQLERVADESFAGSADLRDELLGRHGVGVDGAGGDGDAGLVVIVDHAEELLRRVMIDLRLDGVVLGVIHSRSVAGFVRPSPEDRRLAGSGMDDGKGCHVGVSVRQRRRRRIGEVTVGGR